MVGDARRLETRPALGLAGSAEPAFSAGFSTAFSAGFSAAAFLVSFLVVVAAAFFSFLGSVEVALAFGSAAFLTGFSFSVPTVGTFLDFGAALGLPSLSEVDSVDLAFGLGAGLLALAILTGPEAPR